MILIEIIAANNHATLEELSDLLSENTQGEVRRVTLGRITQKLNYSFKKKTLHAAEKESERVEQRRVEYWFQVQYY